MRIEVKYFGMVSEATCKEGEIFETNVTSLSELNQKLLSVYPELRNINFKFAINEELKSGTGGEKLNENDVVAILPPFAGG